MSEDNLKDKIEFVEKMKQENPRAFDFLSGSATSLLKNLENDLIQDFDEWFKRAKNVMGIEKVKSFLIQKAKE